MGTDDHPRPLCSPLDSMPSKGQEWLNAAPWLPSASKRAPHPLSLLAVGLPWVSLPALLA